MSKLLFCAFIFVSTISPGAVIAQQDSSQEEDSTVTYPASYFEQFSPVSVNDMLNQIPGIDRILDADLGSLTLGNQMDRGLGASSPILIDGKRLAGKANEAASQLDRIAAIEVDYIEIIRGTSSDLDVQNAGQLVNIVLKQAQSRSSFSFEAGVRHFDNGKVDPEGSLSLTGQSGKLSYQLSASARSGYQLDSSSELSLHPDLRFNEIVEFEQERNQTNYSINSNLSYDFSSRDRFALNALYAESNPPSSLLRRITDFNSVASSIRYEREIVPSTSDNWEIGGDYEHKYNNGSKYKFLFIMNERDSDTTRERFTFENMGDVENKNLFLNNSSRYQEKIIRTSYAWNLAQEQGIEVGIEAAQTTQDSALKLGLPLPGATSLDFGGLRAMPVANAVSTVEELRYEGFVVHNWRLNPRMSLESSLVAEFSEIEQTGDIDNKRDFDFIKPKFDFRFDINSAFQMRLSAEKTVSQLSFADFSAATNNQDEDQDTIAGNPEIEQEQWWRYTINLDYRLPNDGGVLTSRVFYWDVEGPIGRIDISPSATELASTNGNVGNGFVLGLNLDASIRLGFIGLPQALLTAGLLVRDTGVDDPLIAMERKVVPNDRGSFRIGFRHDVPSLRLNYGFSYNDRIDGNRPLYDIDNVLFVGSSSDLTAFVEKTGFAGLTYRLEVINILDHDNKRERRRYDGYLRDDVLSEIERFSTTSGVKFALKVRGTF
jgi:outer membrane receptor for ferrienterochelin and colicins